MSETAIEPVEPVEPVEPIEAPEFDYAASQAEKATQGGWKPLDEYVAGGKDPEEWVDASTFNVRGEFITKLKNKDRELDERIGNLNKMHEGQMEVQRSELTARKEAAILEGGKDSLEDVKNIDHQLNQLAQQPVAPRVDPVVADWEERNPWIDAPGPKGIWAKTLYSQAVNGGSSPAQALQMLDAEIAREYPTQTMEKQSITERGSKPGNKPSSKALSMSDVTTEELKWRDAMPDAWKDEKKFLKAVQDSRKST